MAILIVDDESSTRTALRDLLTQLGHKTIIEAKNGEEGLKTAELEKSRIRMIVADWEMPYMDGITLMDRISELPDLDLAPFLLITSDLPRSKLAELQARTQRLDAFLIKPFRIKALAQAMNLAQKHRSSTRSAIILFEGTSSLSALKEAVDQADPLLNWGPLTVTRTLLELQEAVKIHSRQLGAIVIDPSQQQAGLAEWLSQFSRTPLGTATPVVCASRDPKQVLPFRMQCQFFVAQGSPAHLWGETFAQIRDRLQTSLECELLFQELKTTLQQKDAATGTKIIERILTLDPANGEAHSVFGDLLETQGKRAEALKHYRQAMELNPCQPRPYIRLLDILPLEESRLRAEVAEGAAGFCPQNQDVLMATARSWKAAGNRERAREIALRILTLNPTHPEAKTLVGAP